MGMRVSNKSVDELIAACHSRFSRENLEKMLPQEFDEAFYKGDLAEDLREHMNSAKLMDLGMSVQNLEAIKKMQEVLIEKVKLYADILFKSVIANVLCNSRFKEKAEIENALTNYNGMAGENAINEFKQIFIAQYDNYMAIPEHIKNIGKQFVNGTSVNDKFFEKVTDPLRHVSVRNWTYNPFETSEILDENKIGFLKLIQLMA